MPCPARQYSLWLVAQCSCRDGRGNGLSREKGLKSISKQLYCARFVVFCATAAACFHPKGFLSDDFHCFSKPASA